MTTIHANDFDPPLTGKQVEQVQEIINSVRRSQLVSSEPVPVPEVVQEVTYEPLTAYKVNETVLVLDRAMDEVEGFVQSIDKGSHHLHVHTAKGPITVASKYKIRKKV